MIEINPELTSEDNQKIHDPFVQYTVNRLKRPETKFPAKLNLQEDGIEVSVGGEFFAKYNFQNFHSPSSGPFRDRAIYVCLGITL